VAGLGGLGGSGNSLTERLKRGEGGRGRAEAEQGHALGPESTSDSENYRLARFAGEILFGGSLSQQPAQLQIHGTQNRVLESRFGVSRQVLLHDANREQVPFPLHHVNVLRRERNLPFPHFHVKSASIQIQIQLKLREMKFNLGGFGVGWASEAKGGVSHEVVQWSS